MKGMDFSLLLTFLLLASRSEELQEDAFLFRKFSQEGDGTAFEKLYHRHKRWVYLPIEGKYLLRAHSKRVSFKIGPYDPTLPLVIDPVVTTFDVPS